MPVLPVPRPGSIVGLLEDALPAHGERLGALAARAERGGDAELVHDVRVALRRLEALARLFRGVPGKGDADGVRGAARDLRRRLSVLRSEEVGRALLAERAGEDAGRLEPLVFPGALPPIRVDAAAVGDVATRLEEWRGRLAASLDGADDLRGALAKTTRRRLKRRVSELSALLPPVRKTLHPARIAAKRLRYALEIVEPLGYGSRPLLRLLRAFQDEAGDAHDLVELAARVRDAAAGPARERRLGALAVELEDAAARAFAAARRRGAILAAPVGRLRPALGTPESR